MAKIPRRELSIAEKIALLDQIQSLPSKISARRLSEITGVPKSTLARLVSQKDKLRELWTKRQDLGWTKKRKREGKDPDVEDALAKWFAMVSKDNVQVNGPILKAKAVDLAQQLGHMDFKATDGWLSRWKSRHNIKLKKITETDTKLIHNISTDEILSPDQWILIKLPYLLNEFCSSDVYNVGETELFYNAAPNGNLYFDDTVLETKDYVTMLCCSNMSGCDKKKLCIVGQHPASKCFNGLSTESLPILYFYNANNQNGKLNSEIFKDWLQIWDMELQWQSRKVLLLLHLNKSLLHPELGSLQNIQFEFLPISQPMDMGIISNLKNLYRARLVNYILEAIEANVLTANSTALEVSSKITFLQAMQLLADSWRQLNGDIIQNCFMKCGIKHFDCEEDTNMTAILEHAAKETVLDLQRVKNYEIFLSIDTHNKEQIVKQEKYEGESEDPLLITNQTARKCISDLRRYFMQHGNEESPLGALDLCADFVHVQSFKRMRQATSKNEVEES